MLEKRSSRTSHARSTRTRVPRTRAVHLAHNARQSARARPELPDVNASLFFGNARSNVQCAICGCFFGAFGNRVFNASLNLSKSPFGSRNSNSRAPLVAHAMRSTSNTISFECISNAAASAARASSSCAGWNRPPIFASGAVASETSTPSRFMLLRSLSLIMFVSVSFARASPCSEASEASGSAIGSFGSEKKKTETWYAFRETLKHAAPHGPRSFIISRAHAAPAAATAGASTKDSTTSRAQSFGKPSCVYGRGQTPTPGGSSK
mmetsp:Transcript_3535/g.14255  ORF Transcript_3535/g.14255 Transcript_3535/m.14255 type:complete len:265 (-) Transcript_3535:900-1694(-)